MQFCVSEADALKKQCAADPDYRCVASGCMAWRWIEIDLADGAQRQYGTIEKGYCGLAGPPWSEK